MPFMWKAEHLFTHFMHIPDVTVYIEMYHYYAISVGIRDFVILCFYNQWVHRFQIHRVTLAIKLFIVYYIIATLKYTQLLL